jgi:hypothetical protein
VRHQHAFYARKVTLGVATTKIEGSSSRDEKLENLIVNHSMIVMGMFEEAFFDIAERLSTTALSPPGEEATRAEDSRARSPATGSSPPVDAGKKTAGGGSLAIDVKIQIEYLFAELREEASSELPKDPADFARYVSSPLFDEGISIVESYDFGRPKLTERLTDEVLASYVFLLQSGDAKLESMTRELSEWRRRLPRPQWAE